MAGQEQEGPVYDWRTSPQPPVLFDWQRQRPDSLAPQSPLDVLRGLGMSFPQATGGLIPGPGQMAQDVGQAWSSRVPRPVQLAVDPLGPEQGPQTPGEYAGYALGAMAAVPAGTLKGLRTLPRVWKAVRNLDLSGETARGLERAQQGAQITLRSFNDPWIGPFTQAAKAAGWDDQTVSSAHAVLDKTAQIFRAHPEVLPLWGGVDATGQPLKVWRENADFGMTFDVNRTCQRVAQYWSTVKGIEQKIQRPMNEDELLYLGQRMRNDGDIPGCVFCYVEASRRAAARNASILTSKSAREVGAMELDDTAKLPEYAATRDALLTQAGWVTKQGEPDLKRFAALAVSPEAQAQAIQRGGPEAGLVGLFKQYVRSAKGTVVSGNGTYFGELLKLDDAEIAQMNARAGARWWSATDFDPTQMVETLKGMSDSTVRNLAGHGYTKEPYTSLIFGNTGMKINTSVAVTWDGKRFVSDDVNGMPLAIAMKLRETYPDTGTMLVAKNLDQIKWGLDHPQIDMMIPHHAANWTGGPKKYGVFDLDDFSSVQHEHWAPGTKVPQVYMPKSGTYRNQTVDEAFGKVRAARGQGPNQLVFKYWLDRAGNNEQRAVALYLDFCRKNGVTPKFGPGTYKSGTTQKTERFPGFTDHPGYAKLLKDYARTDTPQRPLDVNRVDQKRMVEYLQQFAEGGGWTTTHAPNPTTVDAMVSRLRPGAPPVDVGTLRAAEEYLRTHPPTIRQVSNLRALRISRKPTAQTPGSPGTGGVPKVYLPLSEVGGQRR